MRKQFQYNFSNKQFIIIEFDVIKDSNNKATAENITLTANFPRMHLPRNPQLSFNEQTNEYTFFADGVWIRNGDIDQMIMRILRIVDESNR